MVWAHEQTFDNASACGPTDCDACHRTVSQELNNASNSA